MKFLLLIFLLCIGTGCATQSTVPLPIDYKYEAGAKIGFMSALPSYPAHRHFGSTALGNFEKDLPVSWELDKFIFDKLSEKLLSKFCYELIDLSASPGVHQYIEMADTPDREGGLMTANLEFVELLRNDFRKYDLEGLLFIVDYKIFHSGGFGGLERAKGRQSSYGIESDSSGKNQLSSAMGARVYSLKAGHYIGGHGLGGYRENVDFEPVDYRNLSPEELHKYELYFKGQLEEEIDSLVERFPRPKTTACRES